MYVEHEKRQTLTDWSVQKIYAHRLHTRATLTHTHTHLHAHEQSCVTDSAGALSTVDNWDHHCAALQWAGYPRSLMFVFMYICFEGGRHKKLNSGQNKALGDPASPPDLFHGGSRADKWSSSRWQCADPLCDTVSALVCVWWQLSVGGNDGFNERGHEVSWCQRRWWQMRTFAAMEAWRDQEMLIDRIEIFASKNIFEFKAKLTYVFFFFKKRADFQYIFKLIVLKILYWSP